MNYLVVGLGAFGYAVAYKLTSMGHDVMGIDADMRRVEEFKDQISSTMQLSLTDEVAVKALPLKDINEVLVAIDNSIGDSILAVTLLKKAGVSNLTATATTEIHRTILESLGVENIIMPESYAANIYVAASDSEIVKGVYDVCDGYQIIEIDLPVIYTGLNVEQTQIESRYGIKIVTVKRPSTHTNILGVKTKRYHTVEIDESFVFEATDRVILFGAIENINRFKKQK